jgi:hypothetical protein
MSTFARDKYREIVDTQERIARAQRLQVSDLR